MRRALAKSAAWTILARWTLRLIGIVSTLVLARLLVPEDFGLVAMAMTVVSLVELMSYLGMEMVLIRHAAPTRQHYDTAWTLNLCVVVACASITALASYPASLFFNEPRLTAIMLIIAATWAVQSLENIGTVDFRRYMQFDKEFAFVTGKKLAGFVVTLICAFSFRSYWALVAGLVASRIAGIVLSYKMHALRPRWCLALWREMLSFTGATLINGFLHFAGQRTPHIFAGRLMGAAPLGIYAIGEEIASLPVTEIVSPVGRALFPGYSRLASDLALLGDYVLQVNATVMTIVLPACAGIALLAEPVVRLGLGDQWLAAIPLVQVLAISAGCSAIQSNSWSVYYSLGRPYLTTRLWLIKLAVLGISIWPMFTQFGLLGIAYADLVSTLAMLLADIGTLLKALQLKLTRYLGALWRPVVATAVMAAAVQIAAIHVSGHVAIPTSAIGSAIVLAAGIGTGIAAYSVMLLLLWRMAGRPEGMEALVLKRAQRFFSMHQRN